MSQTTDQPQVTTLGAVLDPAQIEQVLADTQPIAVVTAPAAPEADSAADTQPIEAVDAPEDDEEAAQPETEPETTAEPEPAAEPNQPAAAELPAQPLTPAQKDTHAAEVLARIIAGDAPTPDVLALHTRKYPGPYLSAMYHEDADQSRLQAAREIYGGEVLRNDDRHKDNAAVYFELRVLVDGVEVRFWTLVDAAQIPAVA